MISVFLPQYFQYVFQLLHMLTDNFNGHCALVSNTHKTPLYIL